MIPSLSAVTAGGGMALPQFIELARNHGFSGIELSLGEAAQLVEEHGLATVASWFEREPKVLPVVFGLSVEWRQDEETFQKDLERLPELIKIAQDLDSTRCTTWVVPEGNAPLAEYAERSKRRLGQVGQVLAAEGIRLGLEFIGPEHFRANPDNCWFYDIPGALQAVSEIENEFELENLGLLIDCWHWYTSGGTMMDLASVPLEKIVHVHINDAPDIPRQQQQDNQRLLPGASGVIDIVGFLQTLQALGYSGPVAVETFSAELNALPAAEAATRAHAAVAGVFNAAGVEPLKLL